MNKVVLVEWLFVWLIDWICLVGLQWLIDWLKHNTLCWLLCSHHTSVSSACWAFEMAPHDSLYWFPVCFSFQLIAGGRVWKWHQDRRRQHHRYRQVARTSTNVYVPNSFPHKRPRLSVCLNGFFSLFSDPLKYFGYELGAQTMIDAKNDRYIVNGSHDALRLQELLDGFIKKFVLCPNCNNPETVLASFYLELGIFKYKWIIFSKTFFSKKLSL